MPLVEQPDLFRDFLKDCATGARPRISVSSEMEATRLPGGRVSIRVSGLKLEGTPRDAMRVLGYSKQRIYELIEAGEIEARPRTPGRAAKAKPDKLGRRRSFSLVVDMVSVYRLKYGERKAAEIAAALSGGRN